MYKSYLIVVLAAMFSACGANQDKEALQEEDREDERKVARHLAGRQYGSCRAASCGRYDLLC